MVSVIVDFIRARALRKAAASLESQALASDAEHFANDMLGALAVIGGLGVIALHHFAPIPDWLVGRADAIAALLVAMIAFRSVWSLGSEAVRALMDDVPAELTERLKKRVESIDGVVHGTAIVRTRFVGNRPFVEVKLGTPRGTSLESAHQLTENVERELSAELGDAEAIVHVEPTATPDEPRAAIVRAIADRLSLRVHNLNIYLVGRETRIELDLELPDTLTLAEAHRHSESLEAAIVREVPGTVRVTVHLEPRSDDPRPAVRHPPSTQRVQEALSKLPEAKNVKLQDVLVTDEGLVVTLEKIFRARRRYPKPMNGCVVWKERCRCLSPMSSAFTSIPGLHLPQRSIEEAAKLSLQTWAPVPRRRGHIYANPLLVTPEKSAGKCSARNILKASVPSRI